jgi:hypothetical protein
VRFGLFQWWVLVLELLNLHMPLRYCASSLGIATKLWATRLRNRGSISGRGHVCFCSAERPGRLLGRPGLLFNDTHRRGMKLTTSFHLTPRLGMNGALPPPPPMPSCRSRGQQFRVKCSAFSITFTSGSQKISFPILLPPSNFT